MPSGCYTYPFIRRRRLRRPLLTDRQRERAWRLNNSSFIYIHAYTHTFGLLTIFCVSPTRWTGREWGGSYAWTLFLYWTLTARWRIRGCDLVKWRQNTAAVDERAKAAARVRSVLDGPLVVHYALDFVRLFPFVGLLLISLNIFIYIIFNRKWMYTHYTTNPPKKTRGRTKKKKKNEQQQHFDEEVCPVVCFFFFFSILYILVCIVSLSSSSFFFLFFFVLFFFFSLSFLFSDMPILK